MELFAWRFTHAAAVASGCSETAEVFLLLGLPKSQARHFSCPGKRGRSYGQPSCCALQGGRRHLGRDLGLEFSGGHSHLQRPGKAPESSGISQSGLDLQRKMFACCRVRVDPQGAKETTSLSKRGANAAQTPVCSDLAAT